MAIDLETGVVLRGLAGGPGIGLISPDGTVTIGNTGDNVAAWSLEERKVLWTAAKESFNAVRFTPDGRYVLFCKTVEGTPLEFRLVDAATGKVTGQCRARKIDTCLANLTGFSADGSKFGIVYSSEAEVFSISNGSITQSTELKKSRLLEPFRFSMQPDIVLLRGNELRVYHAGHSQGLREVAWNATTGAVLRESTWNARRDGKGEALALAPGGERIVRFIITGGVVNQQLEPWRWEAQEYDVTAEMRATHKYRFFRESTENSHNPIQNPVLLANGLFIYTREEDRGRKQVWEVTRWPAPDDVESGHSFFVPAPGHYRVAISGDGLGDLEVDGSEALSREGAAAVTVWLSAGSHSATWSGGKASQLNVKRMFQPAATHDLNLDNPGHVAVSGDGKYLAIGTSKGIRLFEVDGTNLADHATIDVPADTPFAFSRDKSDFFYAVGSTVRYYDIRRKRENKLHQLTANCVHVAPFDKGVVALVDNDKTTEIFMVDARRKSTAHSSDHGNTDPLLITTTPDDKQVAVLDRNGNLHRYAVGRRGWDELPPVRAASSGRNMRCHGIGDDRYLIGDHENVRIISDGNVPDEWSKFLNCTPLTDGLLAGTAGGPMMVWSQDLGRGRMVSDSSGPVVIQLSDDSCITVAGGSVLVWQLPR